MTTANTNTEDLTNFTWDEGAENTFFGIKDETETTVVEEVIKDKEEGVEGKDGKTTKKAEEKVAEEPKFEFGEGEGEGKPKTETEDKSKESTKETKTDPEPKAKEDEQESIVASPEFFKNLASDLKERGIFEHVEVKEDEPIDEDKFFELYDEEVEQRVDATINSFMEEVGDDGKAFLKFLKLGGSKSDFLKVYAESAKTPVVDDFENETQAEKFLKYYYSTVEELAEADAEDRIEWLKERNKLSTETEKLYKKVEKANEAQKQQLIENQAKIDRDRQAKRTAFIKDVTETANKVDEVNGLTIDKKEKTELVNFITKATVKMEGGNYITGFQDSINKVLKGDKDKLILLAKLLKSNFDFSSIQTKVKTEVTKEAKSKLAQQSSTTQKPSSKSSGKSLVDYFN